MFSQNVNFFLLNFCANPAWTWTRLKKILYFSKSSSVQIECNFDKPARKISAQSPNLFSLLVRKNLKVYFFQKFTPKCSSGHLQWTLCQTPWKFLLKSEKHDEFTTLLKKAEFTESFYPDTYNAVLTTLLKKFAQTVKNFSSISWEKTIFW